MLSQLHPHLELRLPSRDVGVKKRRLVTLPYKPGHLDTQEYYSLSSHFYSHTELRGEYIFSRNIDPNSNIWVGEG